MVISPLPGLVSYGAPSCMFVKSQPARHRYFGSPPHWRNASHADRAIADPAHAAGRILATADEYRHRLR